MSIYELLPPNIRRIHPYIPGKPIEEVERELGLSAVKMASNENPLGPSPVALEAIRQHLAQAHRYPIGDGFYLRRKLAERLGVPMEEIILGSGSTDIIELVARTFLTSADDVITARQSFVMYTLAVQEMNSLMIYVPLKHDAYDLEAILDSLTPRTKVIFLANPNNPTGTMVKAEEIDQFLKQLPSQIITVLDEAYYEYVQDPEYSHSLEYVRQRKHVIVLRTFSKIYGLAGLRVGYGIAHPDLVNCLNKVRSPFNTTSVAQAAALAALDDEEHVKRSIQSNKLGYEYLVSELNRLGVRFVPSVTNFTLVDVRRDSLETYQRLLERGVIVRPLKSYGFPTALRVTIGTPQENAKFIRALEEVL
jgi:histidinol-phosphate aminotransferase